MDFNSVYSVLLDIFPQVDARLLRAVAIEHPRDPEVAVGVVLTDVIPDLSDDSITASSHKESDGSLSPSIDADTIGQPTSTVHEGHFEPLEGLRRRGGPKLPSSPAGLGFHTELNGSLNGSPSGAGKDEDDNDSGDNGEEILVLVKNSGNNSNTGSGASSSPVHKNVSRDSHVVGLGNPEIDEVTSLEKPQGIEIENYQPIEVNHLPPALNAMADCSLESMKSDVNADREGLNQSASDTDEFFHHEQSCANTTPSDIILTQQTDPPVEGDLFTAPESSYQLVVVPEDQFTDAEPGESFDTSSVEGLCGSRFTDVNDQCTVNSSIIRSSHSCSTDLLEEMIEDAHNTKNALVSATDPVIGLMGEVELQEKAAEQAKEDASRGGMDILAKANDLKQALARAKEANDMHAGEVYAEKAILATEMKELQNRLLSLSEERDTSLGILDEMRKALEERLSAAQKEIEAGEQEKLQKESSAREVHADLELAMEKLVQESKTLEQEAEENSKLQEFLTDRGRVIDMLQGEISVKCQDIKLLKEKFDRRVKLGRSPSESPTASTLSSSSSSLKSTRSPQQAPGLTDSFKSERSSELEYKTLMKVGGEFNGGEFNDDSFETLKISSRMTSTDDDLFTGGYKDTDDDQKALVNDGWELFDKGDEEYFKHFAN